MWQTLFSLIPFAASAVISQTLEPLFIIKPSEAVVKKLIKLLSDTGAPRPASCFASCFSFLSHGSPYGNTGQAFAKILQSMLQGEGEQEHDLPNGGHQLIWSSERFYTKMKNHLELIMSATSTWARAHTKGTGSGLLKL